MKLVLKAVIGSVIVLLGWAYWSGKADPSDLNSASADFAASTRDPAAPTTAAKSLLEKTSSPRQSTASEPPAQVCLSAEQLGTSLQKLQQQRISLTNQLLDLHIQLGIEKPLTQQVLQAVGGDLEVFQFRQAPRKKFNFPLFKQDIDPSLNEQNSGSSKIDLNTLLRVQVAIAKQDYDALLQIIQKLSKYDRHRLFADPNQSLLGRIIIRNRQIPLNVIQQFIDAGIKPNLGDLAALTALDFPVALIAMLQQHFQSDLQQQWQDNFRSYNLSLLAAENASAELFEYWLAQGVPVSIAPQAPNAFDLIPLPTSEQQLQRQISKVRTLLAAGVLPRAADVRSQWLLLLPKQEAAQLSELLQQQPTHPIDKDGPDTVQLIALQQLQAEFNQLLQQVAACPKAQQWPAGVAISRNFPERGYLKMLQRQQQSMPGLQQMSEQDLDNHKLIIEFIQKKDWVNAQILMQQLSTLTAERANFDLLMVMMIHHANLPDLQRQLTHITQLNEEQIKQLSELASSAQREMFKAAGFELPYNARAEEFHKHRQEMEQQRKKAAQQPAIQ